MKHDGARASGRPERVGPYPVVDRIGAGAFGEVFLAKHPSTGDLVCVKRAHPNPAVGARSVAMFLDEAMILSRVSHPNIVSVFDAGQEGGVPYLVMERVEGLDLASLLRTMPSYRLPAEVVAHVTVELARALSHAHAHAVIHRDVKPANVLVGADGRVKLADFGVARLLRGGPYAATSTRHEVGSEPYMAPELCSADTSLRFDHRVDLWSLGVLAWECLCGFRPFEDAALGARPDVDAGQWALINIQCDPPRRRSIQEVAPEAPEALRSVIERVVQPIEQRIATADEVERQLLVAGFGLPEHQASLAELVTRDTVQRGSGVRPAKGAAMHNDPPNTARDTGPLEVTTAEPSGPTTGVQPAGQHASAEHAPIAFEPGMRVGRGRYEILYELGRGGMGATFVAKRTDVGKRVCLKTILPSLAADPSYRALFLAEARVAATVSHPKIAALVDFDEEHGSLWIASELVDGPDLNAVLRGSRGGALEPRDAACVISDIAAGLHHMHTPDHRRGPIIHRDVSPKNIIVSFDGDARLIDFGVAKMPLGGESTHTNAKGKFQYMAPEVLRGEAITAAIDQWALGVVAYRVLTGHTPWAVAYDGSHAPAPASPYGPLDPRWSSIVARLLQPDPSQRYGSLAVMLDELAPLVPEPSARLEYGRRIRKRFPPKSVVAGPEAQAINAAMDALNEQRRERRENAETTAPEAAPAPPAEDTSARGTMQEPLAASARGAAPEPRPTPPVAMVRKLGEMRAGDQFGEWTIVRKLGEGGMAIVYEATRTRTIGGAQRAALKLIRPEHAASDDFRARFEDEVGIALRLNHQNIVHVLDAGIAEGVCFMAMEYVDGCDVDSLVTALTKRGVLSDRRLPADLAIYIGVGLLHGLEYAHEAGVVHRDVSPHNIMITGAGEVKLNDFGVAKPMRADGMASKTSHAVGKPLYMPCEQFRGDPLDGRADLFAAGVSVYEWLAGASPFAIRGTPNETFHMVVKRVFENDRPHTAEVAPHTPPELVHVLERMLQVDREHRPASAEDVLTVLEPLVQLRSKRVLGELVRAVKGEPAAPISQSVLDAVRVSPTPTTPRAGRTEPLPASPTPAGPALTPAAGLTPSDHSAASLTGEVPARSSSRILALAIAFLALVVVGLGAFAAVMFWPAGDGGSQPETPTPSQSSTPDTEGPPRAVEAPAEPSAASSDAPVTTAESTPPAALPVQPNEPAMAAPEPAEADSTEAAASQQDSTPSPAAPTDAPRRSTHRATPRVAPAPVPGPSSPPPRDRSRGGNFSGRGFF